MNAPWFHPDEIDWQDGLNPLRIPAYRAQRNPAVYRALQQPTTVELRNTPGLEPVLYGAPDDTAATLLANATYDSVLVLPPAAWIIGISASSDQPEGFSAQVTLPTGAHLFSQPAKSADLTGGKPHYLQRPMGLPDGGPVRMRLLNLSGIANTVQLVLWVIEPL